MAKKKKRNYYDGTTEKEVRIIPLGGLEQIGMNMTAFECGESIIVVDCGLAFPSDNMPGIDLVVPDITYLHENREKVKAFFITHGHEDHIGAIPYVLRELNVPLYATRLTMAIIETKLEEHGMLESVERIVVKEGETAAAGDFKVEFIHINHSITDAVAFAIHSPAGVIVHTGDFKIDYTPLHGMPADLQRFGELGEKGVLALLSDSTNALRPGFTPSEQKVAEFFADAFQQYPDRRILVATFASNLNRVQVIIDHAGKAGRKVAVEGRSMVKIIEIARSLGYLEVPAGVLVDMEEIANFPEEKTCILMTGSQGEALSALTRVASGQHRLITVKESDVVIFSSSPIPGNEKAINRVINGLAKRGATIINRETHVSGHACEEELKLIYALTRPAYAVPMHGEFYHRQANREIALAMGIPEENTFLLDSGDVLTVTAHHAEVTGSVQHGGILVDGLGVGDIGNSVLRDRQTLSQNGILIVALAVSKVRGELVSGPEIHTRGLLYRKGSEDILEEVRQIAENAALDALSKNKTGRLKADLKEAISAHFWQTLKRDPMILPIILEVD